MDENETWRVIESQRLSLADELASLSRREWEQESLCPGWRVRDVAAHVAMAPQVPTIGTMVKESLRARGNLIRVIHRTAVQHAERPTEQIIAELREYAGSRALPAFTHYRNILYDVLVHGQDIAIPLGRKREMPVAAAAAGATRVWTMGWPFHAQKRSRGVRFVANDVDWSAGAGLPVDGPIGAILLLLTGRHAGLPPLSGPGVELLARRFANQH